MEETTSEKDPRITWQVLQRGLEKVQQGRLDEVDQWLMYAMRKGSSDPLLEGAENIEFLASGLRQRTPKSAHIPEPSDIRVLQALLQVRFSNQRVALESFRQIAKDFPKYHAIIQIQQRINSLDSVVNPPKLPPPAEFTASELQQALERIAREKVALSKNLVTLAEAQAAANEEYLEKYSRWASKKFPLKVFIPDDSDSVKTAGYIHGDRDSLLSAFPLWQKTMKDKIRFVQVPTASQADISCEWVDHPNELGIKSKDAVGSCSRTLAGYSIVHARIRILTVPSRIAGASDPSFRKRYLRNVTLHEIGHALGLGHSQNELAMMFFQLHIPLLDSLASSDLQDLNKILEETRSADLVLERVTSARSKIDSTEKSIASAHAKIAKEENEVRSRVIDFERDLATASDLERFNLWDQANSIYSRTFKYRPKDESIRQATCRTALRAGRAMLKKNQISKAIEMLESAKRTMNANTLFADRQQVLDLLQASYELDNQLTKASEVRALLQSGKF